MSAITFTIIIIIIIIEHSNTPDILQEKVRKME